MLTSGKLDDLGFALLDVYVMYRNTSEWLTVNCSLIIYKVLPTTSDIYFHQKSTILVYILDDIMSYLSNLCESSFTLRCLSFSVINVSHYFMCYFV